MVVTETIAKPGPVAPGERSLLLDALRGLALLGILVVNMPYFASPVYQFVVGSPWTDPADRLVAFLVRWLFESKFFPLFSLLFGVGLVLQWRRAEAAGRGVAGRTTRRLLVLLGFGLVHAVLFWTGDILVRYALLGFVVLWFFRRARPTTLVVWAIVCFVLPVVINAGLTALVQAGLALPEAGPQVAEALDQAEADIRAQAIEATRIYQGANLVAQTEQRLRELAFVYTGGLLSLFPPVLGMILIGLAFGRWHVLTDVAGHRALLRRLLVAGLPLGLALNLVYALSMEGAVPMRPTWSLLAGTAAVAAGGPILALAYLAAVALASEQERWRRWLRPFAAVGRLSLSNYLLQTLVATTIFYGYGLGWYGLVGPAPGLLLTLAIYAGQVALSNWWLRRFETGPAEWFWRTLTYGRPPAFRRVTGAGAIR